MKCAAPPSPMQFETLVDRPPYRALALPGTSTDLVISFASIGHDPGRIPAPEFARSATAGNRPALFILDASRSWTTAPGFAETLTAALTILQTRQPLARTLALGTSMGAFAALKAAEILPLTAILAISPQYHPAARWETRWRDWTASLPETLSAARPQSYTCLMHGTLDDAVQADLFPRHQSHDHFLFAGQTHATLAPHLKSQGIAGMIEAALSQDRRRLLRILASAGGHRRQLPR
jgi:hypothetical protein